MLYHITPVPKPRMTRRDKWLKHPRAPVAQYRRFCEEVRAAKVRLAPSGCRVTFFLPMPESWSARKRRVTRGMPHMVRPDLDNLTKALLDALYENDAIVYSISLAKFWEEEGKIVIEEER